jgi:hypothetical protein
MRARRSVGWVVLEVIEKEKTMFSKYGLGFLFASAIPLLAHHSFAMFDMGKHIVYEGTVVEYRWENPHGHLILKIDSPSNPDLKGTWDIELQATNIMSRQGWNRLTYKAGDQAKVVAHPFRDSAIKGASIFYAIMPDGRRLYGDIARPTEEERKQLP